MQQYVSECVSDEPGSEKAARAYAEIIALLLERELQVEADPHARRIRQALYGLWEEVNASLHLPWRVQTLAARLHLSPIQLYRQVVRYQGLRPMEMVMRLRMQRVEEMLRSTDYTLDMIAPLVGYQTPFALSRAFKKHVGCCPRAYRARPKTQ
jgi:AraC-like DNA-binding protein